MLWPAVVRPLWDDDEQPCAAQGVGIAIKGDVHALFTRVLNQTEHACGTPWTRSALVEVRDVDGNAALAPDVEGFFERIQETIPQAVAHVCVVDAPETCRLAAQLNQFSRISITARRIVQAGGDPKAA